MKKWVLMTALCTLGNLSFAENKHHHSAHTHGQAEITIVHENKQLVIELQTPAINMLGFEHEPRNAEQKGRLQALEDVVSKPDKLFATTPSCRSTRKEIHLPYAGEGDAHQRHEHEDMHEHDNGEHEHDKAGHKHDSHGEHGNMDHQDIHLVYEWHCPSAEKLEVEVLLFDAFPGFEKIRAQWVVGRRQGAATLGKSNSTLEFRL